MSLAADAIHFGFVTTLEMEGLGLCGGMLLLNPVARPLEFHCTLPIKPTRSQEILYGPSLRPFLCGHVIAKALLEKTKTSPQLVVTDCLDTANVSECCELPLIYHAPEVSSSPAPGPLGELWKPFQAGEQEIQIHWPAGDLPNNLKLTLERYGQRNDFAEPFERIRQAIMEAHQVARKAA